MLDRCGRTCLLVSLRGQRLPGRPREFGTGRPFSSSRDRRRLTRNIRQFQGTIQGCKRAERLRALRQFVGC